MGNIALTIAGSDSCGGAGIQADIKTFSALGVYGCSVITAITAQNTKTVIGIEEISDEIIRAQITSIFSDLSVDAIKLGMVFSKDIINVIFNEIKHLKIPIILDPVMIAKSGDSLLKDDAITELKEKLIPISTLLTPNLPEASKILSCNLAKNTFEMAEQGKALCKKGAKSVLIKGGHQTGEYCDDVLVLETGESFKFSAERKFTKNTHGTGCSYSSAITALIARGYQISKAVEIAHEWLQGAISFSDNLSVGNGHGPIHHFYKIWENDL